jgi:hypothetical protein
MLLVVALLGALGGLAYELLQRGRQTDQHLGWLAGPAIGATAALAVLYLFPPQIPTITVNADGTSTTSYVYDPVRLVALSLIVGSGGGTILTALQARVLAETNQRKAETAEQKVKTAEQKVETAEQKVQTAEQKVQTVEAEKEVMRSTVEHIPTLIQPVLEEQIKETANELPPQLADKLADSTQIQGELKQLVEDARSEIDPSKRVADIQNELQKRLEKVVSEVKEPSIQQTYSAEMGSGRAPSEGP